MKRVSPLLALAVALTVGLSACTKMATTQSGGQPGTAANGSGRHPWTKPGVLRIATLSDPDTLNTLLGSFQIDVDIAMFWGGFLFNYDDRNAFVPELATVLPTLDNGGISKDGLTVTYHLRHGVRWHDGAPFDAKDVVFTWRAIMNPNNNVQTRTGYDVIRTIETPDPYTAVVRLKRPFAPFVAMFFTMSSTPYTVLPRHLLEKYPDINRVAYNSAPVGTGPFMVKEWHRGQTLRMVANPHYWRGAPKLKEVDFQSIPDENTLATSMGAHDIDLWFNASTATYPTSSKIPNTHVVLTPFTQYSYIGFNNQRAPTNELAVRRAIAYATDRKRLIDTVSYGVQVLNEGDQPRFLWAYDAALRSLPYDPAQARAMLDEAGWKPGPDGIRVKNGQRLHLVFVTSTGSAMGNRVGVLLQSAYRDIGLEMEVKSYATALLFASYAQGGILQTGKYDAQFASWVNGVDPDDSTTLTCDAIPPNGQNSIRFCNAEVDAQERIAMIHYDRPTRKKAYDRIQEILVDQVPALTMWFARRYDIVSDDVKNYKPAHAVSTFWNTWEYEI